MWNYPMLQTLIMEMFFWTPPQEVIFFLKEEALQLSEFISFFYLKISNPLVCVIEAPMYDYKL